MIIYKNVSTDSLPGVTANLIEWRSLSGLGLDTVSSPGVDGWIVAGSSQSTATFNGAVIVKGSTPLEAVERASRFAAFVDPKRGPGILNPTGLDGAPVYRDAVCQGELEWKRLTWDDGNGYQMSCKVTFECDPHGRPAADPSFSRSGAGALAFTVEAGDTACYPTIELKGTLSSTQTVTLTLGGYSCTITGPLTSAQTMRLDFESFEFARWSGASKVASLVTKMSSLDRLELWPDTAYSLVVATTGTLSNVTVKPNSRTL
jgi:hypothetical protein